VPLRATYFAMPAFSPQSATGSHGTASPSSIASRIGADGLLYSQAGAPAFNKRGSAPSSFGTQLNRTPHAFGRSAAGW
jgi:hypothetical protein